MSDIRNIFNSFVQTFLDFTELMWNGGPIGKMTLVLGIIGTAIIIGMGIIKMTRGKKI